MRDLLRTWGELKPIMARKDGEEVGKEGVRSGWGKNSNKPHLH